jgi:ATP diphosphatase
MMPSSETKRLLEIMKALRAPQTGCPWDLEQDFASIAPYTIEEAYEVADAIERDDMDDLRLELGDLLLQVVYHSQIASEAGHFTYDDVVDAITTKMIRRHPHVFGTEDVSASEYSARGMEEGTWERIKAEEKLEAKERRKALGLKPKEVGNSILDDVPNTLPALTAALKLQKKAGQVGFDWNDPRAVITKIREEIAEFEEALDANNKTGEAEEIGDLLFSIANLARHRKIDPENSLRQTNLKFKRRFAFIETELAAINETVENASLEKLESLWIKAKAAGL